MPVINVNGNLVRFDDDLTDDQISAEIEKNPTLFDPNYKAPKPSTLDRMIGFAKSIDPVRIPKTIAEQAEESDGENVAAKQIKGAPVRQSYYNKVLLDQTDFSGRNKNNAHIDYADEEKRPVYSKSDEGAIIPGEKPRLRQTTHYRTESGNVAPADKPETPASFYYPEDKGAITPRRKPDDGILSRINAAAKNDLSGQEQQRELEGLRTDENVPEGGFVASAKSMAGQTIRGAGRVASDYFGADKDNALMEYGAELIRNDPVAIRSLNDIKDRPFLAFKEASGNMVPSFGAMIGTAIVGQGIISAAPLTGPAAPVVAAVGAAVKWLGPAAIAALPSYSGIRDKQIFNDPKNEEYAKSKAIAALGAAAVGTIEVAFGPQNWAISMLTKEGRVALARKLAATTPAGAFLKGTLLGGLQEGGEELAQNPIEQLASYDNPLTKENLEDTAFGGAMGFLGGVAPGGVTNTLNFLNQQAQSKADRINAERVKLGLSKIESAKTVDEAISAAQEVNSQNVTKDDVLRTEDPNLADIERLTGLKPSEAIDEINAQKETVASNPKSFTIIDKNTGKKLFDTDEKNMVDAIDTSRYEAIPTDEYNKRSSKEKSARDTEIVLPDNTSLKAQWDIVDADSVKASLKEGQSQPRDRTRAVSNLQIQSIANNPDYRRLSDSPVMDVGASVLSHDGQIVGGNGRFEALSRAYDQNTAQDYLDSLRRDAVRKGLDPSIIDSMNKPILVRRISEPFDTRKLAIASNSGTSAPYSARENAKIDAERIGDISNLDITDSGDIALTPRNMQIIRDSMKGYTAAEQSSFVDSNGNLSQEGAHRFRNAILYNAYGDSETLTRLIESTDNDMRNVAGALMRVSGDVAKVRQEIKQGAIPKELDITDDLIGAVEKIAQLRSQNIPVQEYLAQQDIFGNGLSDDAKQIVTALHDNIRSQNKIAQFIRDVYDGISRVNIATGDMLGNQIPSKGDVIQNAKPAKAEQGKVFTKPANNVTTKSGQESAVNAGNKESGGETAKVKQLLSKSQKQQSTLTKEDIQPLADKYNKKLTYGKIIVLNNINELPEGTIKLTGITESDKGLVEGVYLGRQRVYIIADAFDNMERVDSVIQHELAHLSTEELLDSKEYKTAIRSVNLLDKSGNKTIRDIAKIVDKRQPGLDADTRAKEILAMSVETGKYKNISALRRVVSDLVRAFKAMLRRLGVKLSIVDKMSEQEVFATMRNAMDMLYSEKNARQKGQDESLKSTKEQIPETLNIDGIDRPTRNSNGQLIHPTEDGIKRFWKWFSGSKITDDKGRPLVVYHGTPDMSFDVFKPETYFTEHKHIADIYTSPSASSIGFGKNQNGAKGVYQVYLKIDNPFDTRVPKISKDFRDNYLMKYGTGTDLQDSGLPDWNDGRDLSEWIEENDKPYDGLLLDEGGLPQNDGSVLSRGISYVPIKSAESQVKSALGNNGDFSNKENNIYFSKAPQQDESSLDLPEETFARALQRKAQDKFNRFNVIKEFLEKEKGIKLSENADVYRAEERYHSKVTNQIEDFREKVRNPLIKKWADAGYTKEQIEEYLKQRHALEANIQNRKLTGEDTSNAYGITDEQAQEYLDKAPKELAKLADEVQEITDATQKLRLDNGIETQERVDAMRGAYKYYIPVRGDFEAQEAMRGSRGPGGRGFDVRYRPKRRLGHAARNEDVIGNIFQDYERAIVQVEKNRVAKSLALMAAEIQMPDLISIDQPIKRKVLRNEKAYGVLVKGALQDIFQTKEAAEQNKRFIIASQKNVTNSDITIAPITDQRLVYSASPMLDDNEVMAYMNGHEIRIQIKDDLLAQAYKNLGVEALPAILRVGRAMNGWMSKAYTGYNPEFILTNLRRDFTTGIINTTGEEGFLMAMKAVKNYPRSFASLLKYAATGVSNKWIDSYRANGGNTGAAYLSDLERLGEEVNGEYAAYQGVLKNLKAGDRANALRAAGRKAFNASLKYIEHLNQAGENAYRLAVFKAMIESGKSVNEAIHLAKNVTVNFNRKGELGGQFNAAYLFFNANLQGSSALAHALFKGKHKYQAWALAGGGLTALGYVVASALGGFDDPEKYDAIGDAVKSRNMIFAYGDGYVKIPVPYGAGFFYNVGRIFAEAQRKGEIGKLPYQLAAIALEEFSPFNVASSEEAEFNSQKVMYGLLPTVPRIPMEISGNFSTFTGREMYPEKEWYKSEPDNEKMWRGTKGTVYDVTAQLLVKAGIEISPETLKYLTRTATGGAGSFADSVVSAAMLKSQGADLEAREIPFLRKEYGEVTIQDMRQRHSKAKEEAVTAAEKFNAAMRKNDLVTAKQLMGDTGELIALKNYADKLSDTIKYLRDMQDSIKLSEDYTVAEKRLKIKELEKREEKFYNQYLDIFKTKKSEIKRRQEK